MTTPMTHLETSRDPDDDARIDAASTPVAAAVSLPAFATTMASPIGPLTLVSDGTHLTGVYMENHTPAPRGPANLQRDPRPFREVVAQLGAYFSGDLVRFDLPLRFAGTAFQRKVWQALRKIPCGTTLTYGELARAIGQPTASRAVGLANGRNPISIVVPCHRVIGSGGALTGYAGGVERKRWLLRHEGVPLREAIVPASSTLL